MIPRLSQETLAGIDDGAAILAPGYDRSALAEGVVHLGLGAFHRAHQAVYFDNLARDEGDMRWGIVGVSLRSPGVRDRLAPQDGLFTVLSHDDRSRDARIIGVLKRMLVAPEDPEAVVAAMAQPSVHVVTLTVTEKGYGLDRATGGIDSANPDIAADLASLKRPRSAAGFIVAALARRRAAGLPPFAAISCDNLPHNGQLLRAAVLAMAQAHDDALAAWIADTVPFPATMVDRIVPAITAAQIDAFSEAHRYRDEALVETESFSQWVVERYGLPNQPDFEAAGASVTTDVAPWEAAKLRMLNAAHSLIAYLGGLAGIDFVHEFVGDAGRRAVVERLWDESVTTLTPVAGLDVRRYRDDLMARFANPHLRHRTHQIAMDGSQKLPQRLVAPLRERYTAGQNAPVLELAVAAWMAWQRGRDAAGDPMTVDDPLAARTAAIWGSAPTAEAAGRALLSLQEIFGSFAVDFPGGGDAIGRSLQMLIDQGPCAAMAQLAGKDMKA